jgi:hypothetical protein
MPLPSLIDLTCPCLSRRGTHLDAAAPYSRFSPWIGEDRGGCGSSETASSSAAHRAGAQPSPIDLTCPVPSLSLRPSLTWNGTYSVRLKNNSNRAFLRALRSDAPPPWLGGDRGGCAVGETVFLSAVLGPSVPAPLINLTCPLLSRRGTCLDGLSADPRHQEARVPVPPYIRASTLSCPAWSI